MEIVIKITDKMYQRAVDLANNSKENTFNSFIYNSIKDGTPLPKGHGRIGDIDALLKDAYNAFPCSDIDDTNIRRGMEIVVNSADVIIEAGSEVEER